MRIFLITSRFPAFSGKILLILKSYFVGAGAHKIKIYLVFGQTFTLIFPIFGHYKKVNNK